MNDTSTKSGQQFNYDVCGMFVDVFSFGAANVFVEDGNEEEDVDLFKEFDDADFFKEFDDAFFFKEEVDGDFFKELS
jgi:hypothetical protein